MNRRNDGWHQVRDLKNATRIRVSEQDE
jgi:hypothetical protein